MNKDFRVVTNTQKTILGLLRVALGNDDEVMLSADINWQEVASLAKSQGVYGVCLDAVQFLQVGQRPDRIVLLDWIGQVFSMEKVYGKYTAAIKSFGKFCESQNIPVLLMKGYGCSLNYPKPNHRPCGDIDIYLGRNKEFLERLILSKGARINYDNEHHAVFSYQGFTVESHDTVMDANNHKSNAYINELLEELAVASILDGSDKKGLVLPSSAFNSIHLLRHMASDFAEVRTTLRHVLDWATFVAANEVDWNFVQDVAKKSNMIKFLDAINGICVHHLGYPETVFPVSGRDENLENRVLNEILTCTDGVNPPGRNINLWKKVQYGVSKTKRLWRNRWKYAIVYDESLWDAFLWKARNRASHI